MPESFHLSEIHFLQHFLCLFADMSSITTDAIVIKLLKINKQIICRRIRCPHAMTLKSALIRSSTCFVYVVRESLRRYAGHSTRWGVSAFAREMLVASKSPKWYARSQSISSAGDNSQ